MSNRKYGNNERSKQLYINELTAQHFTLLNAYVGYFNICGELTITKHVTMDASCAVAGDQTVGGSICIGGSETVGGSITAGGAVQVGGDLEVFGNAAIQGNLDILRSFGVHGDLNVGGDLFMDGRILKFNSTTFRSNGPYLGINVPDPNPDPQFGIDLYSDTTNGLREHSYRMHLPYRNPLNHRFVNYFCCTAAAAAAPGRFRENGLVASR